MMENNIWTHPLIMCRPSIVYRTQRQEMMKSLADRQALHPFTQLPTWDRPLCPVIVRSSNALLSCDETDSMCDASTSWKLRNESTTPSARTQSATWCVPNFWLARCLLLFCASERSWQENVPDWGFMYAWPYLGPVAWGYKMSPRERVSIDINHSETDALTIMT